MPLQKNNKKYASITNKSKKIISVFLVLLLITTIGTSITASAKFSDKTLKERIENLKEKTGELIEDLSSKNIQKSDDKTSNPTLLQTMTSISKLSDASTTLTLYTNYNGTEKTNELKLFREIKVNVDEDSDDDISVKCSLYPSIERPFALSINFGLTITRLNGFNDVNAEFKVYAEFNRPGTLVENATGDKIRWGYHSPDNELVPNTCIATYKLVPHILSLNEKPEHKVHISPSDDVIGKADLDIILSYVDPGVQSAEFKVSYIPASESQISLGRHGGGSFSITKENTGNSKVDLLLTHIKDSNTTYAYVNDLPGKVSFTIDLGREGKIEFNTHGEKPSEIGLCDNIDEPVNRIYFSNLASIGRLEWTRDLLVNKYASIHGYTDGKDVSLNAHLQNEDESIVVDLSVVTHDKIDFSVEIDLLDMCIEVLRNEFDVSVLATLKLNDNTISTSFDISRINDGSFKISFNELSLGTIDVTVYSERTLTISNLMLIVDLPGLDIGMFAEEVSFGQDSEFNCVLKPKIIGDEFTINASLDLGNDNSIFIKGFQVCINGWCCEKRDIDDSISFEFSADIIEIHVASDFSWGYILLRSIYLSTEHSFTVNGELGGFIGIIDIESTGGALNISWDTIDGKITFAIDGSAVAKLENFHIWLSDRFDISIPLLTCAFTMSSESKSGELEISFNDKPTNFDVSFENLDFSGIGDISLSFSVDMNLQGSGSGSLYLSWNETGLVELNVENVQGSGYVDIIDFELVHGLAEISFSRLYFSGDLNFELHVIDKNILLYAGSTITITDMIISELHIYIGLNTLIPLAVSMDLELDGQAIITFEAKDKNVTAEIEIVGNADLTIDQLWVEVPGLYLVAYAQDIVIAGQTTITVEVDTKDNIPIKVFVNTEEEISIYAIGVGYIEKQMIYVYDVNGGAGGGYIGVGISMESGNPVIYIHGEWYLGYVNSQELGVTLTGSLKIEGFLDLVAFSYVYVKAEIYEDTTITTSLVPGLEIILTPGYAQFMMNQGSGQIYLNFYTTSWVIIRGPEGKDIRLSGYGDIYIYLDLEWEDDGKIAFTLDIKKLSGVIEIIDTIRIAGDAECFLDFSCNLDVSGDTISISNLDINLTGNIDAVVQIKPEDGSWIPIIPFTTDPYVVLIKGTSMKDDQSASTITDSTKVGFEAWYCPPISLEDDLTGTYTYTFSFSNSPDTYQVTTDETYAFCPAHTFPLGGPHTITVTVDASNPDIPTVDDEMYLTVKQQGYCTQSPDRNTRLYLNYDDVGADGKIHTWINVRNLAVEEFPYSLHWAIEPSGPDDDLWNIDQWTLTPNGGVLDVGEDVDVDVGIVPPNDHEDHYHIGDDVIFVGSYDITNEDDSEYTSVYIFDGCIFLEPSLGAINLPAVEPGGNIASSFWIRNMGRKSCNWSIASHPTLGTWEFSSPNSGMIPNGGSAPVSFTVTAPDMEGLDLSGEIKVVNLDDPSDYHTVQVNLKTKGESGPPAVVEVREENGKIILKISGYININVDNFQFTVNGVSGLLNGYFHFESTTDYVEVTIDPDGSEIIAVDGSGEFNIQNFMLQYGNSINVQIGDVVGSFEFNAGRSGRFDIDIDETFTDVDIFIDVDFGNDNFYIDGTFDVDITGETDGYLWIEWDLNSLTDAYIDFGGDLTREGSFTFEITDFELLFDGLHITADQLILITSGGELTVTEDSIEYSTHLEFALFANVIIDFENDKIEIQGKVDISGGSQSGLYFKIIQDDRLQIELEGSIELDLLALDMSNDFMINYNDGQIVLTLDSLHIVGADAYLYIGDYVELSASLTELSFAGFEFTANGKETQLSGAFTLSSAGRIYLRTNLDLKNLEFVLSGSGTLTITSFNININNGYMTASGDKLSITGYGSLIIGDQIEIAAGLSSVEFDICSFHIPTGEDTSIDGVFSASAGLNIYLRLNPNQDNFELVLSGSGSLTITSFYINVNNGDIYVGGDKLKITGSGTLTITKNILLTANLYVECDDLRFIGKVNGQNTNIYIHGTINLGGGAIVSLKTDLLTYINVELGAGG